MFCLTPWLLSTRLSMLYYLTSSLLSTCFSILYNLTPWWLSTCFSMLFYLTTPWLVSTCFSMLFYMTSWLLPTCFWTNLIDWTPFYHQYHAHPRFISQYSYPQLKLLQPSNITKRTRQHVLWVPHLLPDIPKQLILLIPLHVIALSATSSLVYI